MKFRLDVRDCNVCWGVEVDSATIAALVDVIGLLLAKSLVFGVILDELVERLSVDEVGRVVLFGYKFNAV